MDSSREFFTLCGFSETEYEHQIQRIDQACSILKLGPADMDRASARVRHFFDIELQGVRKALGVWLKELIDLVLAREEGKRIIYFGYPPFQYLGLVIKAGAESRDNLYVGCPEVVLCHTLGQMFHTLAPVIEAGEAAGLPPGRALCSLLQTKLGALEKGFIPVPDLSIATSYFCDTGPKADELMQHRYGGYPVEYLDSCMDAPWGTWPDHDPTGVWYLGTRLENLFQRLQEDFGVTVTDDVWEQGRRTAGRLYRATGMLVRHLAADPMPLSSVDAELILTFTSSCTGPVIDEGAQAVELLAEEVAGRVQAGEGILPKGAPRVLIMLPSIADPAANRVPEEAGLAVAGNQGLLPPLPEPPSRGYATLGQRRAEKSMFGGHYHSSYGMLARTARSAAFAGIDGIINNYQFSCRPLVCSGKSARAYLEKETGLPTLGLEMDLYDERNYSIASLRTRLETFAEMLKARAAASAGAVP